MKEHNIRILLSSDRAVSVEFGNCIDEQINEKIRAFCMKLEERPIPGITEIVPTYRSVMIHYEPEVLPYDKLTALVKQMLKDSHEMQVPKGLLVRVPVCYGGQFGPDLSYVAAHHGISEEEVIRIHTAPEYLIYMLGFTPGFAYMGGMDEAIATPRLKTPRQLIPAGSVGIAGSQTGIYPIDSPGGWQLIGQTPLKLYDPHREEPILFAAGQRVQFYPVDEKKFMSMKEQN